MKQTGKGKRKRKRLSTGDKKKDEEMKSRVVTSEGRTERKRANLL